jgi:hypothetical protein
MRSELIEVRRSRHRRLGTREEVVIALMKRTYAFVVVLLAAVEQAKATMS